MALPLLSTDRPIDRDSTTPFLLRVFCREHAFHAPADFAGQLSAALTTSSLDLYAWPDTTLSELTSLVTTSIPDQLPSPAIGTRLGYRLIYHNTESTNVQSQWSSMPLGTVVIGEDIDSDDQDGEWLKTLADARFVIGDYISCVIVPPREDGSVAPLPPADRGGGRHRGGHENGHAGRDGDRAPPRIPALPRGEWARGERLPDAHGERSSGRYR